MNFQEQSLSIIKDAHILHDTDFNIINTLKDELDSTFRHTQIFRTRTEMESSVLNDIKFPTPDSKYWQAVREQGVMYHELVLLSYSYRRNQVEIKKLMRQLETEKDELEKEIIQIDIDRMNYMALDQERVAKDRIREIQEWHEIKEELLKDVQYSLEKVDEHQLVSYTIRWIQQMLLLNGNEGIADRINIVGLVKSGLRHCKEKGLISHLNKHFGEKCIKDIEQTI